MTSAPARAPRDLEIATISVFAVERGRITRYEVFEPEDLDLAQARFEELAEP